MSKLRGMLFIALMAFATSAIANGVGIISKIELLHFDFSNGRPTLYIVSSNEEVSDLSTKALLQSEALTVKVKGLPFIMKLRPASQGGWLYGHVEHMPLAVYVLTRDRAESLIP